MTESSPILSDINQILQRFAHFGVHLSLTRIERLLANLGNPQNRVPIIHVAGTNGKGSVCAYLSSVLTQAGYRVGRYTSPHLVNWCERICINNQMIMPEALRSRLETVIAAVAAAESTPTQFEIFTAAAWLHFAEECVDIAVIEVGLGGRLDATNVCDRPLVSVITPISREHWQRLGPTVADIAGEKAGILKADCPAVIAPQPAAAAAVFQARLKSLNCPAVWPQPAQDLGEGRARYLGTQTQIDYSLSLSGAHQLVNSAVAIAALESLQQQGWEISETAIQQGMAQTQWAGRLQWTDWVDAAGKRYPLLLDGAHNPAAAVALRQYVDQLGADCASTTATWIMGMLATKDHADVFEALLRPGDRLYLVSVPGHLSANPVQLAEIAQSVCPKLSLCQTSADLITALPAATLFPGLRVLCGSLYLVGAFLQELYGPVENTQNPGG
ncbi:MAG: bifunctional folylpolyglutamate synthase/dihydrofolate synthase [Leptolyngbyaceae cyanobacterium SM1_1_3]|nr:bifunctional folylpolyglutamate synthase/dihydrofolate synthase [Leptolyngbyaceae cyanobacterium SM1_1_3]NJN03396.1 bifunctional folylpolyglutamate synthase/dihydrofolate synthase [Leptolyngbyaceae cyanobacterium RM1_1_2]NJO10451.1 bifunctional folylpolyglutamate synthase/dihydrofolate synthase [Leptolyngbyaceae cyanobacterium SL_1_1]